MAGTNELAACAGRPGLYRPVRVDPRGLDGPSRAQARGPAWRRTSQGFYLPTSAGVGPDQRILEAAPFLDRGTAVTGWASLRWMRGLWFDGTTAGGTELRDVPVLIGTHHGRQAGFRFTQERLTYTLLLEHDGLPVTDPWSATCFEMRHARSIREAVVVLDMACQADLVSLDELAAYLTLHNGWTGIPQARQAWRLGDENSWSPQETRMRLVWVLDCGFPAPLCNIPIFDRSGRHVLTPDIFDPVAGVCGEYDGAHHLEGGQRRKDRDREETARDHGLEYFTVLAGDLGTYACEQRMRAARARARRQSPEDRSWTLDKPYWWTPTETVEQRRRLPAGERTVRLGETA